MAIRKFTKWVKYLVPAAVIFGVVWFGWATFSHYKSALPFNPQDLKSEQKELANELLLFTTAESPRKSFQPNQTNDNTTAPTKSAYKSKLITNTTCRQNYFLLILVSSAPSNLQRRKDIRGTWGVDTAIKPRWKTVFLVAQTRIQSESDSLFQENDAFGDLVRADYLDHYWNQTFKIQMGFEWAARYCNFSFLLKMDDDSFANPKGLISFLNEPSTPKEKLYMGQLYTNQIAHRSGKWKVSFEEYREYAYPNFCPGFGIVLSPDVVHLFVELFKVVPKFRLDDVYIALLAVKVGVTPVGSPRFNVNGPSQECVPNKQFLVWHGVTGQCLFKIFQATT